MKKTKISVGGSGPQIWPQPHDPRNLSRPRRGAHDGEKILQIARIVFEKIGVK